MNNSLLMNGNNALLADRVTVFILAAVGFLLGGSFANAQTVQHLSNTRPGGMPGLPVMGGVELLTNGVQVTWDGPSGYYQVYQKSNNLLAPWVALGKATNLVRYAVVTKLYSNAFFRVSGPSSQYIGAQACAGCHDNIRATELKTPHAGAFTNTYFVAAGGQTNSSCLPCHTVGYGLPTGFVSQSKTPQLAGVQCENCHGPAGNHQANQDDLTVVPRVEIAATVCGGCHTGPMNPTYEDWTASGHAAVVPDALQTMSASTNNISSCGRCHSGSVRLALINGQNPIALTNDLNVAITCAVCHDPHSTNANPAQVRNPLHSTNYFSLSTSDVFTNVYAANTNINICGQCHNSRGAAWTDTSRAPHRSPQYNFLLGSVGLLWNGVTNVPATFNPGTHAGLPASAQNSFSGAFYLTNQCVSCHMQPDAPPATTQSHTFEVVSHNVCLNCHSTDPGSEGPGISNEVTTVLVLLKNWAATKGAALQTNDVVAWEYTTPGGLILQTNSLGYATGWTLSDQVNFTGPNAAGQALIPDNIKKARFNLYLVVNDGSLGTHNWFFALDLLFSAESMINQELSP
ncbi:MAG: cytochrome c family protein [Verrucomicrobiota bacterium]